MNSKTIPAELPMDADEAYALTRECWQISLIAELLKDNNQEPRLRDAVSRMTETLKGMDIEVVDFSGRSYDRGMVPEVVESSRRTGATGRARIYRRNHCADGDPARTGHKKLRQINCEAFSCRPQEYTKVV